MGNIKEIDIKNQTYYFFEDMINTKTFDTNLLKKTKSHKKHWYLLHWIDHNKKY